MRKIMAVLLVMLMLLCGCSKESTAQSAETPTLPQESEITDNEYGSRSAENEDDSIESGSGFTTAISTDKKADIATETKQKPETRKTQNAEEKPSAPTPTPAPTPDPEIDIAHWVAYAKSYANSVGLNLNSDAVDCWDNPITANSKCVYLERDIANRLERYAADEAISDVWIWSEVLGNGAYNIYIGYA